MSKPIRQLYDDQGVVGYYSENSDTYQNPHSKFAIDCLVNQWNKNFKSVLDLACGDGLITKHLTSNHMADVIYGCDKFMYERYTKETGNVCYPLSFEDIASFNFDIPKVDIIVISYAIDLIPKSYLNQFLLALSFFSEYLLIIRPNNHSIDETYWKAANSFKSGKSKSILYQKT